MKQQLVANQLSVVTQLIWNIQISESGNKSSRKSVNVKFGNSQNRLLKYTGLSM